MLLDQSITTILSTLLGGVLAITGGFLATSFSQRMAEKAEGRKLARERIEELYTFSTQMKKWVTVQILRACEVEEVTLHRKTPGWFFDVVNTEEECPIDKMEMLINLYLPSMKSTFAVYRQSVLAIQQLEAELRNNSYTKYSLEIYCKTTLVIPPERNEFIKTNSDIVVELIVALLSTFGGPKSQVPL